MTHHKLSKKSYTLLYSVFVLVFTWVVSIALFSDPNLNTDSIVVIIPLALAMFFPAILAFIFKRIMYRNTKSMSQFSLKTLNKKSLLFAILYPILFILLSFLIVLVLQIGKINFKEIPNFSGVIKIIVAIFINMIILIGEEYGWRGYLLPELTEKHGKIKATVFVGLVWALFHVPVVYLSAKASGMSDPLLVCLIQAGCAFVFSFAFSYCYYLSKNLIPVLLMHSIWNEINTLVLGNISSNKQGFLHGNLLYINGEGIVGLVIGALMVLWFIALFRKEKKINTLP